MNKGTTLIKENEIEIVRLYKDSKIAIYKLAKLYHVNKIKIVEILNKNNIYHGERIITDEQEKQILKLYLEENVFIHQLMKMYRVGQPKIEAILDKYHVRFRRSDDFMEKEKEQILNLYVKDKVSILKIAKMLRVGHPKIKEFLMQNGIDYDLVTKITEEKEKEICRLYVEEKLNLTQIGKIMGFSIERIGFYLRKHRIIDKLKIAKYPKNENYFNEINSHSSAYWLGWLLTDGYMFDGRSKDIRLEIQSRDSKLLEKFKKCLKSENPIIHVTNNNKNNVKISLTSKNMVTDLKKLAMTQAKSHTLEFPKIKDEYFFSFLCGSIMGDGWISLNKDKRGYLKFTVAICSASKLFIKGILETSKRLGYPLNWRSDITKSGTVMHIAYTSNKSYAIEILDKCFENIGEDLYLDRKYEMYKYVKQFLIDNPVKAKYIPKNRIPNNYKEMI